MRVKFAAGRAVDVVRERSARREALLRSIVIVIMDYGTEGLERWTTRSGKTVSIQYYTQEQQEEDKAPSNDGCRASKLSPQQAARDAMPTDVM